MAAANILYQPQVRFIEKPHRWRQAVFASHLLARIAERGRVIADLLCILCNGQFAGTADSDRIVSPETWIIFE